jgi:hypothetical protein
VFEQPSQTQPQNLQFNEIPQGIEFHPGTQQIINQDITNSHEVGNGLEPNYFDNGGSHLYDSIPLEIFWGGVAIADQFYSTSVSGVAGPVT